MNKEIMVSIITVSYNAGKTIEKSIKSVEKEKKQENLIEYIVIDGASSDNTMHIVEKYSNVIDISISEKDNGLYDALNKGIRISNGDYTLFLAADDELLPGAITRFKDSVDLEKDLWCGDTIVFYAGYYKFFRSNKNLDFLYQECTLRNAATFFKRNIFDRYGYYDPNYKCAADRELFLRLYVKGAKFQIENIPIELFKMGGISSKDPGRYAVPEDKAISIKYGMDMKKAEHYYTKLLKKIRKENFLGGLIKISQRLNLYKLFCTICGHGNDFLTDSQIETYCLRDDYGSKKYTKFI